MDSLPRSRSLRRLYSSSSNVPTRSSIHALQHGGQGGSSDRASEGDGALHPSLVAGYKKPGQSLADAAAQSEWAAKKWVWCPDEVLGYVAGWVIKEEGEQATVACVDDKTRNIPSVDLSKMNPPKFDRVEDIADLTFLNEASVVHNLRERYTSDMIYTYSGPFLVAVNPYRALPIYGNRAVQLYKSRRREECPPHVFAVAEKAWQNMVGEREGQSILITGESGAGKTENTKKVIQYLTAIAAEAASALPISGSASSFEDVDERTHANTLSNGQGHGGSKKGADTGRELENQIIQANPILEAFGNAQTVRNNNSSRFGKFVRIEFSPSGTIAGATIDWYLLEKSRVTARSDRERSFHVFYQLLKGSRKDLRKSLLLSGEPGEYAYLRQSRLSVEGVDDHEEWRSLEHALNVVGFSPDEQFDLFRIVAAILHLGNVAVTEDRSQQAYIRDNSSLEKVCHLLGLPIAELSKALLRPRVKAGREWVTQARTKKQVEDEIGSLCKAMYEKSFSALVERINRALSRPTSKSTFIGVLDIAGFEIFETNGFEQLCINYTNEKLQQFFNHHMFVLEQEEYARENIDWQFVNFGLDLQPTIDLIESTTAPCIGILSTLDEECIMPKASDATFTEKLHQMNKKTHRNSVLKQDEPGTIAQSTSKYAPARFAMGFTISHYAGKVEYRTDGWLDKNRDPLNTNITTVLANSSEKYVATLFEEYKDEEESLATLDANPGKPAAGGPKRRMKRGAFRTVAQRHKEQLNSLMAQLRETQPHFVRCIVPNEHKKPGQVNVPLVLDQLRCNGVLEGIRIARLGYPNRLPFVEFKQRYEVLTPGIIPKGYMDGRKACQRMTEALDLDKAAYRIGLNKIFFKAGVLAELEERRDELLFDIFTRLQAGCRRFVCQRRIKKQLNRDAAIRTIQRNAKIYLELKNWPWWMLYTKLRPLLAATRTDDELRKKDKELALVQERAQRDADEKVRLEQLKMGLEAEKKKVQDALESERALNLDKDSLLARSKEREAQLEEELATMQADLDTLDNQLERALTSQAAAEKRYNELKKAFEDAAQHVAKLEAESQVYKSREATVNTDLETARSEVEALAASKTALTSKIEDLKRAVQERDQDHKRARSRLEASQADLQGKLSIIIKEKDNQSSRASSLEAQQRHAEQHIAELQRTLADFESATKRKEGDLLSLQTQLRDLQKQKDAASSEATELRVRIDGLSKQVQDGKAEVTRITAAKATTEQELDKLKQLMAAKSSEDVKQKEMAALKEGEIRDLRSQVGTLTSDLSSATKQSSEKINSLRLELENAKHQLSSASTAQSEALKQLKQHTTRLAEVEGALSIAQQNVKSAQNELQSLKSKQADLDKQLSAVRGERDMLEREVTASQSKLQSLEDSTLKAERECSTWQREAESLGDRLEAEMAKRMQLEKTARSAHSDLEGLQLKIVEQDQYIKGLRREMQEKEAELAKSLSLQDRTIVEHVHVLEEAKRYTDKQLSETQARLASMTQYSRTLEKTKLRLQAELEDLTVQADRERLDDHAVEKQFRKLEEQAEKAGKRLAQEERMRQVAEQEATRLKGELARLRSQPSPSPTYGSHSIERSKSAFENVPPPGSEPPSANGVHLNKRYDGIIADLQKKEIYSKDGAKDDALRGRILRELTEANKELEAGMRATLSGIGQHNRTPLRR